jgi:hypothetical protein
MQVAVAVVLQVLNRDQVVRAVVRQDKQVTEHMLVEQVYKVT